MEILLPQPAIIFYTILCSKRCGNSQGEGFDTTMPAFQPFPGFFFLLWESSTDLIWHLQDELRAGSSDQMASVSEITSALCGWMGENSCSKVLPERALIAERLKPFVWDWDVRLSHVGVILRCARIFVRRVHACGYKLPQMHAGGGFLKKYINKKLVNWPFKRLKTGREVYPHLLWGKKTEEFTPSCLLCFFRTTQQCEDVRACVCVLVLLKLWGHKVVCMVALRGLHFGDKERKSINILGWSLG